MYLLVIYSSPWKTNHLVRWFTYHHDGFPLIFLSPKVCLWENGKPYRQASYFIEHNPWNPIHPHHIINKPSISSIIPIYSTYWNSYDWFKSHSEFLCFPHVQEPLERAGDAAPAPAAPAHERSGKVPDLPGGSAFRVVPQRSIKDRPDRVLYVLL